MMRVIKVAFFSFIFSVLCNLGQMADLNTPVFAGEVIIVANQSVPDDELSELDIKNIFLGKRQVWSNDKKVVLAVLIKDKIHKEFTGTYLKKNYMQFNNYWKNMVFTGKARAPKRFENEEELVHYVETTEDAVGYVSSGVLTEKVKKITVKHD